MLTSAPEVRSTDKCLSHERLLATSFSQPRFRCAFSQSCCVSCSPDCLRAERNDPNSKDGAIINERIKEGKIVPSEITTSLLLKAMLKSDKPMFLIDGFPRNQENYDSWQTVSMCVRLSSNRIINI
jgi:hypothetical protein